MRCRRTLPMLVCFSILALTSLAMAAPQAKKKISDNDPDLVEIRHYRLTMAKIKQLAAATDEVNKMLAANPALKKQVDSGTSDDMSIDQKAKTMDAKFPQFTAVIHSHGITTREYIVASLAFMNDVMIVGMKKQGSVKEYPPNTVTPENAAFVEQNYDELAAIGQKMSPPDNDQQ